MSSILHPIRGESPAASSRQLACFGVSYRDATVEQRAQIAELTPTPSELLSLGLADEAVRVQSCNRVETYFFTRDLEAVRSEFIQRLGMLWEFHHVRTEEDAVEHLLRVAASLESLVVGEPQILGQVQSAEATAIKEKTIGRRLRALFGEARQVGRSIRSRTNLGRGNVSVATLAVKLAEKTHGSLKGRRVLLIGAGEMGGIVAKSLKRHGAEIVIAYRRNRARAVCLAEMVGGEVCDHTLEQALLGADIVISATTSKGYVLTRGMLERVLALRNGCPLLRGGHPLLLIDIAHPPDIEPSISELSRTYVYTIDDLEVVADVHREERRVEIAAAVAIVSEGMARWKEWESQEVFRPVISAAYRRITDWESKIAACAGTEKSAREMSLSLRRTFHRAKTFLVDGNETDRECRIASFEALFGLIPSDSAGR